VAVQRPSSLNLSGLIIDGRSSTLIGHSGIGTQTQLVGPRQRAQVETTNRRVRLTAGLGGTLNGKQV